MKNESFPVTRPIGAAASGVSQPFEIIVVDDASTDATPEIADQAGARVVPIHRRQIAAARNAGARAARGQYLFFIDADTRINRIHVTEAMAVLEAGYAGGSARGVMDGFIPFWSRILLRVFCTCILASTLAQGRFFSPHDAISRQLVDSMSNTLLEKRFISAWRSESLDVSRCYGNPFSRLAESCACIRPKKFSAPCWS